MHSSNSDGIIRDMPVIADLNITNVSEIQDTPKKQHQCHPPKTIPNAMDGGGSSFHPHDINLQHLLPPLPTSYSFKNVEALKLSSLMGFHNDGCDLLSSSIAHPFNRSA